MPKLETQSKEGHRDEMLLSIGSTNYEMRNENCLLNKA